MARTPISTRTPVAPEQKQDTISHGGIPLSLGSQIIQGAKDLGGQYVDLQKQSLQGAGNLLLKAGQPFASIAATPIQALAKATGQADPYAQGMPTIGGQGSLPISPLSLEAKTGDVLKAVAEIGAVAAAPATLAGTIGVGAGIGAAQGAGEAMQKEQSANEVIKQGGIGAAIGGATAGAIGGVGKLIGKIGDKIQTSVIRPTSHDLQDGFSIDTIKKYNLGGNLNTTLKKTQTKLGELSNQLSEKLATSPESIDLAQVYADTAKELVDKSKKGFGANTKIQSALDELSGEISVVGNSQSIPDAQIIKQAAGRQGAWQYGKRDAESNARETVYNAFYSKLKQKIEDASPAGVKEINAEIAKLIPISNAVLRRIPIAERNNLISLTDMIGLVGSTVNPANLGITLMNLISKSGTAASQLQKISTPIQKSAIPASLGAIIGQQAQQQ